MRLDPLFCKSPTETEPQGQKRLYVRRHMGQYRAKPVMHAHLRYVRCLLWVCLAIAATSVWSSVAAAQTKLKWAHVYETTEPFHTWAVWASEEIKKRSNGRFEIQVFGSSALGKETDINQAVKLGMVDLITSGVAFAARGYPRLGIAYYPFLFRDAESPPVLLEKRSVQGNGGWLA